MAMPLKAAHGHFAMLLHSKNPPPDMPKADREQFGRAEADASAPHQASLTFGSRKQARAAADFRTYPVTRKSNYLMIIFSPFPVYVGKISPRRHPPPACFIIAASGKKYSYSFVTGSGLLPQKLPVDLQVPVLEHVEYDTVGPIITGRVTRRDREALASCYRSCLALAADRGCESMAFCCISTGEFHFPNREAAEIAVETVRDFLNGGDRTLRIIFDVFKDRDLEIYRELLGA